MLKASVCAQCGEKFPPSTAFVTGGLCPDCFLGDEGEADDSGIDYLREAEEIMEAFERNRTPGLVRTERVLSRDLPGGAKPVPLPITPLRGIGPFLLGSTRAETRKAMADAGLPLETESPGSDACCASALTFFYDQEQRVMQIVTMCDARIAVTWVGRNVFDIPAEELFDLINAQEPRRVPYDSDEVVLSSQVVTLSAAAVEHDHLSGYRRIVWEQVGVGTESYRDEWT